MSRCRVSSASFAANAERASAQTKKRLPPQPSSVVNAAYAGGESAEEHRPSAHARQAQSPAPAATERQTVKPSGAVLAAPFHPYVRRPACRYTATVSCPSGNPTRQFRLVPGSLCARAETQSPVRQDTR